MTGMFVLIDGQNPAGAAGTSSGSCGDGVTWELDDDGTLTIQYSGTGTGDMTSYTDIRTRPWNEDAVKVAVINEGVTSIGEMAFYGCGGLKSVTIPGSVTSIGYSAFQGCGGLKSVTIPDKVESIEGSAFSECGGLKSVIIGDSVESIGRDAFYGCYNLTSVTIPDSVTSIEKQAFFQCSGLTSVTIGDSVESIEDATFSKCYNLTSVTIGDSVESIGYQAFNECYNLTSVTIGDSVTSIGEYAFYGCNGLKSVIIPDSVESIEKHAFLLCDGLLEISFGEKSSPGRAFPLHTFYSEDGTELTDLTEISDFAGFTFVGLSIDRMVRTIEHGVTYDTDGGSEDAPTQDDVREGKTFTVKSYTGTKAGYAFGGWSYGGETYLEGDTVTMGGEDITLTAIWTPIMHRIAYDLNGGSGTAPTQSDVQEGQTFQVGDYAGTRLGYTFAGWIWNGSTYKAGDTIEMGASDIVLEAVWTKNTIFVPIPDNRDDVPEIPVFPEQTSEDSNDDSTSAAIVAAGCVVVLLAILVLVGSTRIGR